MRVEISKFWQGLIGLGAGLGILVAPCWGNAAELAAVSAGGDVLEPAAAAVRYIREQLQNLPAKVTVQPLDSEGLERLPPCAHTPEVGLPPGRRLVGRVTLSLRCEQTRSGEPWSVLTPVAIRIEARHWVARQLIPLEHQITSQDIEVREGVVDRPDFLSDSAQIVGRVARQAIGVGQLLRADQLHEAYVVHQGQMVTLRVQGQGFDVSSEGQALTNGAEGQEVTVRTGTGKAVNGRVQGGKIWVTP